VIDPTDYSITVKRVLVDGEMLFRATVKELPHIAEYGESYAAAYELAVDAIKTLQEIAEEAGHQFPVPVDEETEFSGRITLRMPKGLHRQISELADEEDISLNQYLVSVLSFAAVTGASYFSYLKQVSVEPKHIVRSQQDKVFTNIRKVLFHVIKDRSSATDLFSIDENMLPNLGQASVQRELAKFKTTMVVEGEDDMARAN